MREAWIKRQLNWNLQQPMFWNQRMRMTRENEQLHGVKGGQRESGKSLIMPLPEVAGRRTLSYNTSESWGACEDDGRDCRDDPRRPRSGLAGASGESFGRSARFRGFPPMIEEEREAWSQFGRSSLAKAYGNDGARLYGVGTGTQLVFPRFPTLVRAVVVRAAENFPLKIHPLRGASLRRWKPALARGRT